MEYLIKNLLPQASLTFTALGALAFSLTIIYMIVPHLDKLELDKYFYLSTTPWLISAGGLSALIASRQSNILFNGMITIFLTASLLTAIYAGKIIDREIQVDKSFTVFFTGIPASVAAINFLDISKYSIILQTAEHILYWLAPLIIILYLAKERIKGPERIFPVIAHFMDASSTVISLSNGGIEKQFIAKSSIELLGPYGIFILKALTIVPIVLIIYGETEGKNRMFYLYLITSLGLTITVRNTLLTATGL